MQALHDSDAWGVARMYGDGDWGIRGNGFSSYHNYLSHSGNGHGVGSECGFVTPLGAYTITASMRAQIILTNSLPLVHYHE